MERIICTGKKIFRSNCGFTLVELLVVVTIIAIISTIAIPNLMKAHHQSKDKKVLTDMRNMAIAIGIYRIDYGIVPQATDITSLIDVLRSIASSRSEVQNMHPIDAWGTPFYYFSTGSEDYTLKSFGRDGVAGTPADQDIFDANADIIIVKGIFVASHEGTRVVVQ